MNKNKGRYKKMEAVMTTALCVDIAFFIAYLVFASLGMLVLKLVTAAICFLISGAALYFLYLTRELLRKRSIWMTLLAACTILCILVSLLVRFPMPLYTLT